ncbi:MAG TPA: cell division protein FtsL [Salinisphaeraceae bacterium]|nr:cell division protein FtsL [Salinisphaeraceae bacterium]
MMRQALIVALLVLGNLASAIAVVSVKHSSRELQHDLQVLRIEQDQLKINWAQLRLEESAWANHDRVRRVARTKLDMVVPEQYIVLGGRHE